MLGVWCTGRNRPVSVWALRCRYECTDFTHIISNLHKLSAKIMNQNAVQAQLDSLEKTWPIVDNNSGIMVIKKVENAENYYFKLALLSQTEEKYFPTKTYFNDYLVHSDSQANIKPIS